MKVRALMQVFYAGRDREVGEIFETEDDMHAKVLTISGRVEKVEDDSPQPVKSGRYKHRRMRAES